MKQKLGRSQPRHF